MCTESEAPILSEIEELTLGTAEVEGQWWSTNPESEKEYQVRTQELLAQVQHSPHESIALVAHHDTLQELLAGHVHDDAREMQMELIQRLTSQPPPPCSLVYLRLDFRATHPIAEVALLGDALREAGGRAPGVAPDDGLLPARNKGRGAANSKQPLAAGRSGCYGPGTW